ncbi:MAG TPA: ribosome-associated translation inhibitor RaiA [bacterium]|jgi:putative sigma-54 modulation protein|nr:putative sigma-54 modulation protein [Patescibacteria group bacterium]HRH31886.1 ribosome-associated translation inhibitor RaiA [bacterium]
MRITEIKGTNMELTEAIKQYVERKLESLVSICEKYSPCDVVAEVGKTSPHHQKGDVFYAELNMTIPGAVLRATSTKDDLYAAIDDVKDELKRQLVDRKER